jgi:hypothetical protein
MRMGHFLHHSRPAMRGLEHGWYRSAHISVALWLAGLKLVLAVVEASGASVAVELLGEYLSDFQKRYIREWNE